MRLWNRITSSLHTRRTANELEDELRAHIELRTDDNINRGMTEQEARRDANLRFGNAVAIREASLRELTFVEAQELWADLRYASRKLLRSPAFTIAAVLSLALGIGANIAIFGIVDAVLLKPLPFENPDRLVVVWQADAAHKGVAGWFNSFREYEVWADTNKSFEKLVPVTWATQGKVARWHGNPVDTLAIPAGVDFFAMLGRSAEHGRTFTARDLNEPCVIVLSHHFWERKLSSDPNLIGNSLSLSGVECHVLGVMPASFSFYPSETDLWSLINPGSSFYTQPWQAMTGVFGLLRPGVTAAAAQAELALLQTHVASEAPPNESMMRTMRPSVQPLQSNFVWLAGRNLRSALWTTFGAVGVVFLMTCINLATLLSTRAADRSRELATRSALGASRTSLLRQLGFESMLLAVLGTGVGLVCAFGLLRWFDYAQPLELPPGTTLVLDGRTLLLGILLGVIAAMLFGLAPAWKGSRVDLNTFLRTGSSRARTKSSTRVFRWLTGIQIALSLMLVAAATLLGQSLSRLAAVNLGYRTKGLLSARITLPEKRYPDQHARLQFADSFTRSAGALPGVERFAVASDVTPTGTHPLAQTERGQSDEAADGVAEQQLTPEAFRVLGLHLNRGRLFDTRDSETSQPTAMINEALAAKFFGDVDPIGRSLKLSKSTDPTVPWLTIVGVTENVKIKTVFQDTGYIDMPAVYRPLAQDAPSTVVSLVATRPGFDLGALQRSLSETDPDLLLAGISTVERQQAAVLSQPRFHAILFGGFALLSVLLAALGLYGVLSSSIQARTREIGVRMAVGASRSRVICDVLLQAFTTLVWGLSVGTLGVLALGRALRALLYQIGPYNPIALTVAVALIATIAFAAAWAPARRAASIDPVRALRAD